MPRFIIGTRERDFAVVFVTRWKDPRQSVLSDACWTALGCLLAFVGVRRIASGVVKKRREGVLPAGVSNEGSLLQ